MPRRINQVEDAGRSTAAKVHLYGMAFDGDAFFALKVHVVQHLVCHVALGYGMGEFQQTVCQRAFAMVNMGYDAEVAYIMHNLVVLMPAKIQNSPQTTPAHRKTHNE
jgi:hypothetical protein